MTYSTYGSTRGSSLPDVSDDRFDHIESELSTHLDANLTEYTPTTGITLGTGGAIYGWYNAVGDLMWLHVDIYLGTGFNITDSTFQLPEGFAAEQPGLLPAWSSDAGVLAPLTASVASTGSTVDLFTTAGAAVGATAPITWVAGDAIHVRGALRWTVAG